MRPDQASSDLSLIAAQRALEMAKLTPDDIDQIIVATTTPDRYLPSCANFRYNEIVNGRYHNTTEDGWVSTDKAGPGWC